MKRKKKKTKKIIKRKDSKQNLKEAQKIQNVNSKKCPNKITHK